MIRTDVYKFTVHKIIYRVYYKTCQDGKGRQWMVSRFNEIDRMFTRARFNHRKNQEFHKFLNSKDYRGAQKFLDSVLDRRPERHFQVNDAKKEAAYTLG